MLLHKSKIVQNYIYLLLVLILAIGIFFRCVNIEKKVYWHDEVYTSVRVSGYEGDRISNQIFTDRIIGVEDVKKFQKIEPRSNLIDVIKVLATHPEHPPLYYLLARVWWELFGSSIATIRSLSVVFSLLVFPCIYWLAWELFQSPKVGWMAIALVAVSPFHLLYAQEAREYSLWTTTILLASAALLRSIRLKSKPMWMLYAVILAINFYVSLLSIFVAVSHACYVIFLELCNWFESNKLSKNQKRTKLFSSLPSFTIASMGALLLFSPWLLVIFYYIAYLQQKTSWTNIQRTFSDLLLMWQLHLSSIFIDIDPKINQFISPRISLILLIFILYAIYYIYASGRKQAGLFIITLVGINVFGLILPDLIFGGQRSSMTRYFFPAFLGIELAVAYLLVESKFIQRKLWTGVTILLVIVGLISCTNIAKADTWWNKGISYDNAAIAQIINASDRPLIISNNFEANMGNLISLCHLLKPQVKLMLFDVMVKGNPNPQIPQVFPAIDKNVGDIFVLNQVEPFLDKIAQNYRTHLEHVSGGVLPLWKFN
ncbi:MAG: glycosyltransferase family 39 protein [Xenococcaceae cyanobacterium]